MGTAALRYDPDVEAAVLAHYGLRVRDLNNRELRVLFDRLPPGSWPDPDRGEVWTQESHLLALLVDEIRWLQYTLIAVNVSDGDRRKLEKPKPLPRPGRRDETEQEATGMTATDQVKAFAALLGAGR